MKIFMIVFIICVFSAIIVGECTGALSDKQKSAPQSDSLMQTIVRKQDSILTLLRNQSGYFDSGYDSLDGTKK
jgi:uncharacterized membrane protein affecting hemolysin expression